MFAKRCQVLRYYDNDFIWVPYLGSFLRYCGLVLSNVIQCYLMTMTVIRYLRTIEGGGTFCEQTLIGSVEYFDISKHNSMKESASPTFL